MSHPTESPAEFSERANRLLRNALRASDQHDGGNHSALNHCLNEAKGMRMSWVEGLDYAIRELTA